MKNNRIYAELEKYEHELATLQKLLDFISQGDVSIFEIILWIGEQHHSIQKKIDECKYLLKQQENKENENDDP
jgi:regulator of sigma D